MLFTDKYAPRRIEDIVGNEQAGAKVKRWILNWMKKENRMEKPLLIYGATGTGKTSYAYALKEEFDLELVEMNASQFRDKENIERVLAQSLMASTLSGKRKMMLIDDVDVLGKNDRGGVSAITSLLKKSNVPVILTATDAWNKKISPIRALSEMLQLRKPTKFSVSKIPRKITEAEGLEITDERIMRMAENANGDVRSAINDLQAMHSGGRDRGTDIFNTVRGIFKARTYLEAKQFVRGDLDYETVMLWMDENIPAEYTDPGDIAASYYYMSRADQFSGRIRGGTWKYLKYVIDFMSAGVALSKSRSSHHFVKYQFPAYLREMGQTVERRAALKSIGNKIAKKTHSNSRAALDYLPLMQSMIEREDVVNFYQFSEDEVEFISGMPGKKKRKAKAKKEETETKVKETEVKLGENKKGNPKKKTKLLDFF